MLKFIKNSVFIFILLTSGYIPANSQVNCEEWLTPECEEQVLAFAQQVLEDANCQQWEGRCDLYGTIYRSGRVAIGTENTQYASLTVTDGIIARKLKICETPGTWCDYVFEDDYGLLSLEAVESHIKAKGHLHKTPSAQEVEAEGAIDLGKTALDHQEKIEEVFLHLIKLKKQAEVLQARLQEAKKENELLKDEL